MEIVWELERLPKQAIGAKKGERAEWEDVAKRWPKEAYGNNGQE